MDQRTDRPTDRQTDRPTDMTTPRSSDPELKNIIFIWLKILLTKLLSSIESITKEFREFQRHIFLWSKSTKKKVEESLKQIFPQKYISCFVFCKKVSFRVPSINLIKSNHNLCCKCNNTKVRTLWQFQLKQTLNQPEK